jgi:membrane transport protein XK
LAAFLLGKAGFYAVGAVLGKEMGNEKLVEESIKGFLEGAKVCKPINFLGCGGDELLVGRAGYLCGALWLQQKLGYMPVPKKVRNSSTNLLDQITETILLQ